MQLDEVVIQYGSELVQIVYNNPEATAAIIAAVVVYLRTYYFQSQWPALFPLRRALLPAVSKYLDGTKYSKYVAVTRKMHNVELAGDYSMSPSEFNNKCREHSLIYPDNAVKLKYRDFNGDVQYEFASWAYRPQGFLGMMQVHLMAFDNEDGTITLYAHYELNPYSRPIRHYFGGGRFDAKKGVEMAQSLMGSGLTEQ